MDNKELAEMIINLRKKKIEEGNIMSRSSIGGRRHLFPTNTSSSNLLPSDRKRTQVYSANQNMRGGRRYGVSEEQAAEVQKGSRTSTGVGADNVDVQPADKGPLNKEINITK